MSRKIEPEELYQKPERKKINFNLNLTEKKKKIFYLSLFAAGMALIIGIVYNFYFIPVKFSGQSMGNTFEPGQTLLCSKKPFDEIKIGDIITYKLFPEKTCVENGNCITHRVYYKFPDGSLLAKGDNNSYVDTLQITENNYVAVC